MKPDVVSIAANCTARGMSLREVAAYLAKVGLLSPSGRPYLAGSIAAMLKRARKRAGGSA